MARLTAKFFLGDTVQVAQNLLGHFLVRVADGETLVCRITETEAYVGAIDKACHAYGGRHTPRTETLYAAPGTAYVYLIYGMHHCLNFVTGPEGEASAVLIRGCEPVGNVDAIARRRFGKDLRDTSVSQRKNFMNGPGKVCKALSIDRTLNGLPVGSDQLYITEDAVSLGVWPPRPERQLYCSGKRIGIDYAEEAVDFPWRFWIP